MTEVERKQGGEGRWTRKCRRTVGDADGRTSRAGLWSGETEVTDGVGVGAHAGAFAAAGAGASRGHERWVVRRAQRDVATPPTPGVTADAPLRDHRDPVGGVRATRGVVLTVTRAAIPDGMHHAHLEAADRGRGGRWGRGRPWGPG